MSEQTAVSPSQTRRIIQNLRDNIGKQIKGKEQAIENAIICLLAGGHLLIEDLPGVGKTTLAYCLAKSIDGSFSRIQFTSDLLPGDVTGVSVYDESNRQFIFRKGPVFANIVLADEINRTTPKTQSSLLEVMDRGKVTVDGQSHDVGLPFMVFATQNPVDYEGTFALPESQMDRFLLRISMGYPSAQEEIKVLQLPRQRYDEIGLEPVITAGQVAEIQDMCNQVFLEDSLYDYIVRIATATRTETEFKAGVSPRGTLALKAVAQAKALVSGRNFVIPSDVEKMAPSVLSHRLALRRQTADPLEEKRIIQGLLERLMESVEAPV